MEIKEKQDNAFTMANDKRYDERRKALGQQERSGADGDLREH